MPYQRLRNLLYKEPACQACQRVAQEVWQLKTQGSFLGELDVYTEELSSLSSSSYETSSISSWRDSSGRSTITFSRLRSCRSLKHHKRVLQKQKSSRSSKPASPEAAKVEEMHFPPMSVSMLEAMIQSLESHWLAKRLQHLLGMSWILLRSLKNFTPSAPSSSLGMPLVVRVVVRRPQVLAFVAAKTKRKLELHLRKRVQLKLSQLPRRVQEALRQMRPLPLPKSETSLVQKPGKKAKRSVVTGLPLLQRLLDVVQMKVKLHLTKKCVEILAEVFPDVVLRSWRRLARLTAQPLPKLVSHADKPLQARLVFLPFVLPQQAKKMEMVVQRWRLNSCWDLGKQYVESLVATAPPPSSSKPFPCRREASEFSGAQTPFLPQQGRETLEAHVRKKRLQHEWGLPSVIRRSLKAFLPSTAPRSSILYKTRRRVKTLPRKLAFLPEDTCIVLECHLHRMKLQQRWGLPRRVLETRRRLFPDVLYKEKREAVKPFTQQPRLGIGTPPGHLVRPKKEEEKIRKNQGLPLCPSQPLLALKTKVLKKLQVHLTKKLLEVRLESFPAAPQISWKSCWWSQRQPLPKLILPGLKTPQSRIFSSSCGLAAMSRIESVLQRGHLASLWGLGLKYIEAVPEMATVIQKDAERPRPSDGTREFGFPFAEGKTPFFPPSAREVLEMHLRKKRIQHQWGLPFLVQSSLRSFSGRMSPLRPSKAVTQASVFPRELLFLPPKVTNFLDFHLQRMKLQKRWGLPRRVLESCRRLFPGLLDKGKTKLLGKHYSWKPGLGIKTWAGDLLKPRPDIQKMPGVGLCRAQSLRKLSLQALKKLEVHLTKKHLEVHLETFSALPQISRCCAWLSASQPLPKLILPGLRTPQTRSPCLSFDLSAMGRIEVALQRGRLVSLWGLGLKYVEILAAMCPGGHLSSVRFKEIPVEFSKVKSLFLKNAVRENLEMHVKKKRLQHEWGYSTLVQRSLRSLIGESPNWPRDLPKAVTQISLLHLKLHFLSETVKQNLELHIQRLKLQRKWGIPQKVHRFVKFFHSLLPKEKPQATFGETQVDSGRWEETNILPPKNEGCLEDLLRYTLETHLKKKSLEIKYQLIGYRKFSGPIKHAFLPKCSLVSSEIKPRPSCLYFVEQDIVEKINLNIKCKQLTHLWGLPSIHTKSLNKIFGNVIVGSPSLEMSKLRRWTLEKNVGQESQTANAMVSRTKELRISRTGPCFVQTEILDHLEMHVRCKKLQHEWGLPSMVQKSLQAFAALSLEPKRLLEGLGIAITASWGVLKVRIKITNSLFFLGLAMQKLLEAHMKNRTAAHRWGLPKRVQESLKMFLPSASRSQVEDDQGQAETPRHAYNRLFQTASKPRHKAEDIHHIITVKRTLPKGDLLGESSPGKISRSGREKMALDEETAPMSLKQEDLEFMGLHVEYKRIQHEWGLPALVRRSLQAFAPVPPEPQKRSFRGPGLQRLGDGRKTHRGVQVPWSLSKVLVPPHCLHFFSQDAKDHLESHVRSWIREHKWGLPQLIQDSLRAMVPPPQVTDEKPHLGFPLQEGAHASHSRREGSPWWTSSWKEATMKPMKNIHQRKPDARTSSSFPKAKHHLGAMKIPTKALQLKTGGTMEARRFLCPKIVLSFLPIEERDLLEFHIQQKKIQHAWGLPSMGVRSLHVFAPYLLQSERTTGKITSRKPKINVQILSQDLVFLSVEVKERLEAHLRHRTSEHRWGLPERLWQSLRAFLPPRSSHPEMTGSQPLFSYPPIVTSVQPSRISKGTEDPQILPPSSLSAYTTRDYMPSVENIASFQKVKFGSGRTTLRVKNKMPLPGFKAKMVARQNKDGFQRTTKQRGTLEGLTPPLKPSAPSRGLKKSRKSCLSCHSSAPKTASISSSKSDRQPKQPEKKKKKKEVLWKGGEAVVDDSSLLAEDNKAQDSPWSSGDNMEELEGSSGDNMTHSALQEPEAAKMYYRPWEAHVQPYLAPISQQVSYFFPHRIHVPNSCYEDVVARCYRQVRRGHHATQSSRLHRRGSRLTWREFLDHSLEEATRCQTFFRTQPLDHWFSDCERFLYLQRPSSSRGKKKTTEEQDVQPPEESRKGPHQNQDFVRTDVELQVHHESCSLTLKTDSKEEGRMERVTFSIAKEQSLLSLKTLFQGNTDCEDMRVDDWDQGRRLEVKWEDQNKGAEESFREETGSWTWANSSVVRQPPLAEDPAPSLVALSEEARVIISDQLCSGVAEVVVGSPKDHGVLKAGEISEGKDVVLRQKRQIPVDLMQAGAVGQASGVQRPLPTGMRPISCSPGMPPKAGKKEQVKVSWSSKETHQERLVKRRLAFDPKLSQTLEVPRQGAKKRPQEQGSLDSEQMTILGNILEKKLNLQQGLSVWRQSLREKEEEGRGRKRDRREGRGGQGGRSPQASSTSVDKQSSNLSSILQGKLHLCRDILKGKLCFWKKSQELFKTRRTGKYGGVQGQKLEMVK